MVGELRRFGDACIISEDPWSAPCANGMIRQGVGSQVMLMQRAWFNAAE